MLKSRTLVALALLVLVGAATVWKVTRRDPHVADASAAARPLTVKKQDIDELEISEPGKPAVTLKKDGAAWKITAPYQDRADAKTVEQAVDAVAELKLRDVIAESPESYDKVGVKDDEVVKVVAKGAGKPLAALLVGKTTNVRLEGDPRVWSTGNLKRWALVKEAKLWRDRKILDFPVDQVEKVEVVYPAGKVVAKKEAAPAPATPPAAADGKAAPPPPPPAAGPDKWTLVEGQAVIGGALDGNVPLELASTLARLNAEDVADAAAKTGLDAPRATVTVTLKDGKAHTLLLGADDGNVAFVKVKDADRVWTIQKYEADRIPATPGTWRDKTLTKLEPAEVSKLEIIKGDARTVLERVDASSFKATTPTTLGELEQSQVTALLRTASALRATKVLDGDAKAHGLDKPRGSLVITKKDGQTVKLVFGADKDQSTPVMVGGQKDVYAVASYTVAQLLKSPDELKKQTAAAAPPPRAH